jgi:hypothetical protein
MGPHVESSAFQICDPDRNVNFAMEVSPLLDELIPREDWGVNGVSLGTMVKVPM